MKTYEWVLSIIGILSLIVSILALLVTFYFNKQVSKLSKEANDIARNAYIFQVQLSAKWGDIKDKYNNDAKLKEQNKEYKK